MGGRLKALRPYVAFPANINMRNAGKHKAIINRYGKLIYGGGQEWNGLYTAGTRPYRPKNKKVIAALREYNQVTKGYPLLKAYFVPVSDIKVKNIKPFKGGVKIKTSWGWQVIIPFRHTVLKRAATMQDDDAAEQLVEGELNRIMDAMGEQDSWSLQNGEGSEIGSRLKPRPTEETRMNVDGFQQFDRGTASDKIMELWNTYKDVKHHEFHRWGAAVIGRTVKGLANKMDFMNWLGKNRDNKNNNSRIIRNLKRRFKAKYGE